MPATPAISHTFPGAYKRLSVVVTLPDANAVTGTVLAMWPYLVQGKIVDLIVKQIVAGASGTDVNVVVKKNGATTICSTEALITQAAGANAAVDAGVELATPAGCTAPVLATTGVVVLGKGDHLTVDVTPDGTYDTTFPSVEVVVVVDASYGSA